MTSKPSNRPHIPSTFFYWDSVRLQESTKKMPGSGQLTADSLRASLLPEHNMVKAGHRSCLFPIKPIRKLHESRIFDGTVSEEENNPPSLFVLKSEATAYSHRNFLFPRHGPSLHQGHLMCVTFLVSLLGRKRWQHKAIEAENSFNTDWGFNPVRNPLLTPPTPNNQALCLLWRHRVSQWDARLSTALLAWIYLMNKGTSSLHKQDQVELKRNELRKQCWLIPAGISVCVREL